jgi:hypothetical protein
MINTSLQGQTMARQTEYRWWLGFARHLFYEIHVPGIEVSASHVNDFVTDEISNSVGTDHQVRKDIDSQGLDFYDKGHYFRFKRRCFSATIGMTTASVAYLICSISLEALSLLLVGKQTTRSIAKETRCAAKSISIKRN